MHYHRDQRNGHSAWPAPNPNDMFIRISEDLGWLKAHTQRSLENDGEIFDQLRSLNHRTSTLEANLKPPTPAPSTTVSTTSTSWMREFAHFLKEVMPSLKELVAMITIAMLCFKGASDPATVKEWFGAWLAAK